MSARFYGEAEASFDAEDDGSNGSIWIEISNRGWDGPLKESWCALSVEDAARLAEQIDAAIDLYARTAKARAEAKAARISALKETLAELEAGQ